VRKERPPKPNPNPNPNPDSSSKSEALSIAYADALRTGALGGPTGTQQLFRLSVQHGTPILLEFDMSGIDLFPLFILERAESTETPTIEHRLVFVPPGTRGGEHLFTGENGVL